jgi:hypothetical protein
VRPEGLGELKKKMHSPHRVSRTAGFSRRAQFHAVTEVSADPVCLSFSHLPGVCQPSILQLSWLVTVNSVTHLRGDPRQSEGPPGRKQKAAVCPSRFDTLLFLSIISRVYQSHCNRHDNLQGKVQADLCTLCSVLCNHWNRSSITAWPGIYSSTSSSPVLEPLTQSI